MIEGTPVQMLNIEGLLKTKTNYRKYLENVRRQKGERTAEGIDPNLANPLEMELNKLSEEAEPISK